MRDLKLAFRTLFKTPFVTAVAILSLALGIGANTAIFSMFNEILLRPLPVHAPEQLVNLEAPGPKPGSQSCGQAGGCDAVFSYAMFRDLEAKTKSAFTGLAAHVYFGANLAYDRQTVNGQGLQVSGSYFPTLGVSPALGRLLTPNDDQTIGGHPVAVLGNAFWKSRLGADPSVVGKQILVNGQSFTIVGVAPDGFEGTTLGARPYVYIPLTMRGVVYPWFTQERFDDRRNYWAYVFGRVKPGMTMEQAKAAVNAAYKPIINEVEAPLQEGMSDPTMKRFRAKEVGLADGRRGQSSMHQEASTPLKLLLGITGIVLLIACANIANLLLARGATRGTEMAVRLSLGASRGQVIRQLLTESVVLALMGGIASLLVAYWTINAISGMLPNEGAQMLDFSIKPPVVMFAAGLSIATGLLFGLFPALQSTRPDLITALRSGAGHLSGGRASSRFRSSLVTVQIALSMALLVCAGLFVKSLRNVSKVNLGIQTEGVVTFAISPELNGYKWRRSAALFQRAHEELGAIPGVTGVTAARVALLSGNNWGNSVAVQGFKKDPDTDDGSRFNSVSPGYFRTLGIKMLAGREFTAADGMGAPRVVVVNEAFTKKFGLGRDAVGKLMGANERDSLDTQIIGVIENAKYSEVKDSVPPVFYTAYAQDSSVGRLSFYVRTAGDPAQVLRAIPGVISRLDANLPVEDLKTLPQQVRENVFLDRMISTLSAAFALLATMLAAVGLYGVLAYTVAQRTREIGVRMALGADAGRVRLMVLRQVGLMTVIGGVIGIAAAIAIGRAASSLLFGLKGHDPTVATLSALTLAAVAFAAGYIPARRASKIHPMQALRYE